MPQTIARMYGSQDNATAAAKELQERGFAADAVHVIGPQPSASTQAGADASTDTLRTSIEQTGLPAEHAKIYADHVRQGQVLVTVYPPFGFALTATNILDSHDPIAMDLPAAAYVPASAKTWDPAAPLSSALGWRVLLSDPTPLSSYFKWPTIKREDTVSTSRDAIRKQSDDPAPLSRKIGMPVLSDNPAPLSSKIGIRVLSDDPTPLSSKAGIRVLSEKAAPLSDKLGWRTLLDNPAPLSTKLGWRLLLDNPAPLSSWLGWRVLIKDESRPSDPA